MADRPILFSAPMVRALLDGRKTQTRRPFKPRGFEFYTHPTSGDRYNEYRPYRDGTWDGSRIVGSGPMQAFGWGEGLYSYLPYAPGDRLYVRETWRTLQKVDCLKPKLLMDDVDKIDYRADGYPRNPLWAWGKNRVAIHMPRWASRLTLTVTDVRVERLNDCSEVDAIQEGVTLVEESYEDPVEAYAALWDSINGAGAWEANPWIVAITFTVEQRNIDA